MLSARLDAESRKRQDVSDAASRDGAASGGCLWSRRRVDDLIELSLQTGESLRHAAVEPIESLRHAAVEATVGKFDVLALFDEMLLNLAKLLL